jgi:hypothetical protein
MRPDAIRGHRGAASVGKIDGGHRKSTDRALPLQALIVPSPGGARLSLAGAAADRATAALAARLPATAAPPPAPRQGVNTLATTAKAVKATLVIDGASLACPVAPDQQGRVLLQIDIAGRVLHASVSAKTIRKAVAAIAAAGGPAAVAVVVSGRLEPDDTLTDAGVIVQPRSPKPPPSESAT